MRYIITLLLLSFFSFSCTVKQYYVIKHPKPKKQEAHDLDPVYDSAIILSSKNNSASGVIIKVIDKKISYAITVKHFCSAIKGKIKVAAAPHHLNTFVFFTGKVEKIHEFLDLCLVRLDGDTTHVRPIKIRGRKPYSGMRVYTLGAPAGLWPSKNEGYLVGISRSKAPPPEFKGPDVIALSIPSFYGSSGSPIYDSQGHLVGIIMAVNTRFHHNSIGTPSYLIDIFVSHALQK